MFVQNNNGLGVLKFSPSDVTLNIYLYINENGFWKRLPI